MTSDEFFTVASLAIAAASAIMQGVSSYQTAKTNERRAREEARSEIAIGEANKARQQRINRSREATFEAEAGAQGTTFEGSPMLAYLENVKQGALQAEDFSYEGRLKGYYKRMQAGDYAAQARAGIAKSAIGFGSQIVGAMGGGFGGFGGSTPATAASTGTGAALGTGVYDPRRYTLGVRY